jgi:hypothetical protein
MDKSFLLFNVFLFSCASASQEQAFLSRAAAFEPLYSELVGFDAPLTEFYFTREVTPVLQGLSLVSKGVRNQVVTQGRKYVQPFADRYQITTVEAAQLLACYRYVEYINELEFVCRDVKNIRSTLGYLERKHATIFDINASWMTDKTLVGDEGGSIKYVDTLLSIFLATCIREGRTPAFILNTVDWLIKDKGAVPDCAHETTLYSAFQGVITDSEYSFNHFFSYYENCDLLKTLVSKKFSLFATQKSEQSFDIFFDIHNVWCSLGGGGKLNRMSEWQEPLKLDCRPQSPWDGHLLFAREIRNKSGQFDLSTYPKITQKGAGGNNLLHTYFNESLFNEDVGFKYLAVLLNKRVDLNQKNFDGQRPLQKLKMPLSLLPLLCDLLTQYGDWIDLQDLLIKKIFVQNPNFTDSGIKEQLYQRLKKQLKNKGMSVYAHPQVTAALFKLIHNYSLYNEELHLLLGKTQLLAAVIKNQLMSEKKIIKTMLLPGYYDYLKKLKKIGLYCHLDHGLLKFMHKQYKLFTPETAKLEEKLRDIVVFRSEKQKRRMLQLFGNKLKVKKKENKRSDFLGFMNQLEIKPLSYYQMLDEKYPDESSLDLDDDSKK